MKGIIPALLCLVFVFVEISALPSNFNINRADVKITTQPSQSNVFFPGDEIRLEWSFEVSTVTQLQRITLFMYDVKYNQKTTISFNDVTKNTFVINPQIGKRFNCTTTYSNGIGSASIVIDNAQRADSKSYGIAFDSAQTFGASIESSVSVEVVGNDTCNQDLFIQEAIKATRSGKINRTNDMGYERSAVSAPTNFDCTVRSVPAAVSRRLRLSSFYTQYAHAYGIPVVSSSRVKRKALERACYVMRFLFADRKDIRDWFYRRNGRAGIMARSEGTTTIPEHSFLPAWWNQRARGLGATIQIPISTGGEENLLCESGDRYYNEDIFLHEFVHGIHNLGATGAIPSFDGRLRAAYNSARSRGLWRSTYALSTDREYFAEGTQSFFNVNAYSATPNGIHNHVNTREKLRRYDPTLFNLVKEVFPCANNFLKRCDAKNGKAVPLFRMDCKDGGGTVVTDKPPKPNTPPVPTPPKPDTPPVPTPPKPDTPPVPTPPEPDTPPVPIPPKPDTPPVPTPPKPDTPPLPTPPKPDTPPVPTPPKPDTPPLPTPPKPDTPPVPTPPKPDTPPVPSPPKPDTPPAPTPPKSDTPPVPTPPVPTPPKPTPPRPTTKKTPPPRPSCYDRHYSCGYWSRTGECNRNSRYMLQNCCKSCKKVNCRDYNYYCRNWASKGECRRNPNYMLRFCKQSCSQC